MPTTQVAIRARKRDRRWRRARAVFNDTRALIGEFRLPLLTLAAILFGAGPLYALLHQQLRGDTIPWVDVPLYMLHLMVLEQPEAIPAEWQLAIFWYVMPVLAVFIVGRGAVDFFRLFFDRSGRRRAWEEAVAAAMQNHIIVAGTGHVGLRVVYQLVQLGFDVVAVDMTPDEEKDELRRYNVPIIPGDARMAQVLEKAGVRQAASLVVATSDDHANIEIVMRARDLNPDIRIVARMWDDQFARQLKRFMNVESVLSSSDISAPAFAGAAVGIEITQTLKVGGEDYSMIRLKAEGGGFLDGRTIDEIQHDEQIDVVLHERGSIVTVHPAGSAQVVAGDTVVLFAQHRRIIEIVDQNRNLLAHAKPVKG